jgi:putative FmdB family regulatory protein
MPFYEYQCAACKAHHEELQKVTARPLKKCPACGKNSLRRLVSAPVFRLKGGGWYETDFKADKEGQRNIAGDKEAAPVEAKPKDDKADAKPAAKPAEESASKPAADVKPAADTGPKTGAKPKTVATTPRTARARARRRSRR